MAGPLASLFLGFPFDVTLSQFAFSEGHRDPRLLHSDSDPMDRQVRRYVFCLALASLAIAASLRHSLARSDFSHPIRLSMLSAFSSLIHILLLLLLLSLLISHHFLSTHSPLPFTFSSPPSFSLSIAMLIGVKLLV